MTDNDVQQVDRAKGMRRMRAQWDEMSTRLDDDPGGVIFPHLIQGLVLAGITALTIGLGALWLIGIAAIPLAPIFVVYFGRWVRSKYGIGND